jgi:methylglutaconyl-CoA hydratase
MSLSHSEPVAAVELAATDDAFVEAVESLVFDETVHIVLLTGEPPAERRRSDCVESVAKLPQIVVCAPRSDMVESTLEFGLASDFRLMREGASAGFPGVRRGETPGPGSTQRLPRLIGPGRAAELLFTGRLLDSREARAWGLVHDAVPASAFDQAVEAIAGELLEASPTALRYAKEAMRRGMEMPLSEALVLEHDLYLLLSSSDDKAEGIASFREKRKPEFTGR